jgi:ATP-dependent DNA helicase PIF1
MSEAEFIKSRRTTAREAEAILAGRAEIRHGLGVVDTSVNQNRLGSSFVSWLQHSDLTSSPIGPMSDSFLFLSRIIDTVTEYARRVLNAPGALGGGDGQPNAARYPIRMLFTFRNSFRQHDEEYDPCAGTNRRAPQYATFPLVLRVTLQYCFNADGDYQGGCGSANRDVLHTVPANDEESKFFYTMNPRNKGKHPNSCGIQCLIAAAKRLGLISNSARPRPAQLRQRAGIDEDCLLSPSDLGRIVEYITPKLGFRVRTLADVVVYELVKPVCCELLLAGEHYQLILQRVGRCACGSANLEGHDCSMGEKTCAQCGISYKYNVHRCTMEPDEIASRSRARVLYLLQKQEQDHERLRKRMEDRKLIEEIEDKQEQEIIETVFEHRQHVMIQGQGGTGKTHYGVKSIVNYAAKVDKKVWVVTPTGQAATQYDDATTIHCRFGWSVSGKSGEELAAATLKDPDLVSDIRALFALAVDEMSMVTGEQLDSLDVYLRIVRNDSRPFGGSVVILVGDFLQLPPVRAGGQNFYDFLFDSHVVRHLLDPVNPAMRVFYMTQPRRFKELQWFYALSRIRRGVARIEDRRLVESCRVPGGIDELIARPWPGGKMPLFICAKNAMADGHNDRMKSRLGTPTVVYAARDKGDPDLRPHMRDQAPEVVELCDGAEVMLLVNHPYLEQYNLGNGSRGRVLGCFEGKVSVEFYDIPGEEISISTHSYEIVRGGKKLIRYQIPLRLAWAISIHKAQGMTLSEAIMDLSEVFEYGQFYTALSRMSDVKGLYITGLNWRGMRMVNKRCDQF